MRKLAGFTIIELMLTVAVLGTLLAVGVPAMNQFILNNRITSEVNAFNSLLALARSEAVKHNRLTVVCASTDGKSCNDDADWGEGLIVFVDRNGDLDADIDDDENGCAEDATTDCILAVEAAAPGSTSLTGGSSVSKLIAFNSAGAARCDDAGEPGECDAEDAYFVVCDHRGANHARALTITPTGRTATSYTTPTGDPLECPE